MIASPAKAPPFVTFISTTSYKVVGTLVFDGKKGNGPNATNGLEQCGWSPSSGKFYQNVPEIDGDGHDHAAGAVAVINPKNMKVERLFPIPLEDCAGPQGMAIGPNDQILEGCNAASPNGHRNTVVLSQKNGSILAVLQDLGGADEVWFMRATATTSSLLATHPAALLQGHFHYWSRATGIATQTLSSWTNGSGCHSEQRHGRYPGNPRQYTRSQAIRTTNRSICRSGSGWYSTAVCPVALRQDGSRDKVIGTPSTGSAV